MLNQKYGTLDKDGSLILTASKDIAITKEREVAKISKEIPSGYKPIQYAPIPEFDQEKQAVFQAAAVDVGSKIEVGVEVREVKQDIVGEIEPIIKDPIAKG